MVLTFTGMFSQMSHKPESKSFIWPFEDLLKMLKFFMNTTYYLDFCEKGVHQVAVHHGQEYWYGDKIWYNSHYAKD